MNSPDDPGTKPLNSFRLLGDILAAAVGIRSGRERRCDGSQAGSGTLPGALFILAAAGFVAPKRFIQLVTSAAVQ